MKPEWITAIATFAYAVFTGWIIMEIRRDRKLLHQPILVATVKKAFYPDWLLFNLKNIDKSPAVKCVALLQDTEGIKWEVEGHIQPIGSNDSIDIRFELVDKDRGLGEKTWLEIEYSDVFEKTYKVRIFEENRLTMMTKYRLHN